MPRSKPIYPEPIDEPSYLDNIQCMVNSYFSATANELETSEDIIEWARFVAIDGVNYTGVILGRTDGVQLWEIKKDSSLHQLFGMKGLNLQTGDYVNRKQQGSVSNKNTGHLLGGSGAKFVVIEVVCGVESSRISQEMEMGGVISCVRASGGHSEVPTKLVVVTAGSQVILVGSTGLDGDFVELHRIQDVGTVACDLLGSWLALGLGTSLRVKYIRSGVCSTGTGDRSSSVLSLVASARYKESLVEVKLSRDDRVMCSVKDGRSVLVGRVSPRSGWRPGSIEPQYVLLRGVMGAPGQALSNLRLSEDGRLVGAVSPRNTVHLWPVCGQGGPVSARVVCSRFPANRLSRLQRSGGLDERQLASTAPQTSLAQIHLDQPVHDLLLRPADWPLEGGRAETLVVVQPTRILAYTTVVRPLDPARPLDDNNPIKLTCSALHQYCLGSPTYCLASSLSEVACKSSSTPSPEAWYAHIEISAQITFTSSCIHKLDKFSISTYQERPPSSQNIPLHPIQQEDDDPMDSSSSSSSPSVDQLVHHSTSSPLNISRHHASLQICNSVCGSASSYTDGRAVGLYDFNLLHNALQEPEMIESRSFDSSSPVGSTCVRMRKISGAYHLQTGQKQASLLSFGEDLPSSDLDY